MMKDLKKVFESERIYFVEVSEDLIDDYMKMINDDSVRILISREMGPATYDDELKWVRDKLDNHLPCFSMIEKGTDEFIGNIEIMDIKDNIGELGIAITKDKQDRHYGTESIKAIIDYGYNVLKLQRIELNVYDYNERAIHCYENIGFVQVGKAKDKNDIHMVLKRKNDIK